MLGQSELATGFIELALAKTHPLSPASVRALREDAKALGFFGLLGSLACEETPRVDLAARKELPEALRTGLSDALPDEQGELPLSDMLERYRQAKGGRASELLAHLAARVVYEVYELSAHHFVQDGVLAACKLMALGGPGQNARETVMQLTRLSRRAARRVLGHLDGQLDVVHELSNEELPIDHEKLDGILAGYAPRVYAQRVPSMTKVLLPEDKAFRFVFVLWARLRGVVLSRSSLVDLSKGIDPAQPFKLLEALEERRAVRTALREACEAFPAAQEIEGLFLPC